jgi:hypothetical protein
MPKKTKPNSLEEKLRRLGAKLDDLLTQAKRTKDYAAKINLSEVMRQKAEVERKLKDLKGPAQDAWKEIEAGFESAWKEIRGAAGRAKEKFKKK